MKMMKLSNLGVAGIVAVSALACGGGAKPAEEPPAPSAGETSAEAAAPVAPASSKAVKEGRDAIQAGDFEKAVQILAAASEADPKDAQAAFYHGVALEGAGHNKEAAAEYERAIGLDAELMEARANLSYLLIGEERAEEALAVVNAGLEKDPKSIPLLANRALALDLLGKPEALKAYEALLAVAPDDQANRFNYAVLLAAGEKKPEALAQLARITQGEPELLLDVAQLYGRLEDYGACVKTLDQALSEGKSAELLVHRARCKHSAGDDTGALTDLRDAVSVEPDNPIGHYYLGRHLFATGKKAEAKKELQKTVELGPETPFGQAATRELASGK